MLYRRKSLNRAKKGGRLVVQHRCNIMPTVPKSNVCLGSSWVQFTRKTSDTSSFEPSSCKFNVTAWEDLSSIWSDLEEICWCLWFLLRLLYPCLPSIAASNLPSTPPHVLNDSRPSFSRNSSLVFNPRLLLKGHNSLLSRVWWHETTANHTLLDKGP